MVEPAGADSAFMQLALAEARKSFTLGSIPVGSIMVRGGQVFASGRNRSIETNDPTSHAEVDCIRNGGLQPNYVEVCLYTTLSPCLMCTGAMLFLGIRKVVIAECESYAGDIDFLLAKGMEVSLLDDPDCIALMKRFVTERAALWQSVGAGNR
jgi:cytosine deaminase